MNNINESQIQHNAGYIHEKTEELLGFIVDAFQQGSALHEVSYGDTLPFILI